MSWSNDYSFNASFFRTAGWGTHIFLGRSNRPVDKCQITYLTVLPESNPSFEDCITPGSHSLSLVSTDIFTILVSTRIKEEDEARSHDACTPDQLPECCLTPGHYYFSVTFHFSRGFIGMFANEKFEFHDLKDVFEV